VRSMKIAAADPPKALPGGILRLFIEGLSSPVGIRVRIGDEEAEIIGASPASVTVRVPVGEGGGVTLTARDLTAEFPLEVGHIFASDLHPVGNPVVDSTGNIYVTFSGARGEDVPFGVFKISPQGHKEPFLGDIQNPTGLAIGPDQHLYISSRHTGAVYRSTFDKQVEKFAEGLGIASGMAFDSEGYL